MFINVDDPFAGDLERQALHALPSRHTAPAGVDAVKAVRDSVCVGIDQVTTIKPFDSLLNITHIDVSTVDQAVMTRAVMQLSNLIIWQAIPQHQCTSGCYCV